MHYTQDLHNGASRKLTSDVPNSSLNTNNFPCINIDVIFLVANYEHGINLRFCLTSINLVREGATSASCYLCGRNDSQHGSE